MYHDSTPTSFSRIADWRRHRDLVERLGADYERPLRPYAAVDVTAHLAAMTTGRTPSTPLPDRRWWRRLVRKEIP